MTKRKNKSKKSNRSTKKPFTNKIKVEGFKKLI